MVLGQLDIYLQKNEFGPYLILNTKINPKCIKDQMVRAKTAKLLEENIGVNLCDTEFKQWLLRQGKKHKKK